MVARFRCFRILLFQPKRSFIVRKVTLKIISIILPNKIHFTLKDNTASFEIHDSQFNLPTAYSCPADIQQIRSS